MANFEGLRSCLSNVPFENAFSDDIVQYWSDWKDLFLTAVNKFVPVKTIKDINSPQWIDGEVRQLVRKKYAALKKFRQNRSIIRKQTLRCISQNIKSLIRKKHREYLERVESSFNKNPKFFWSYHKAILHHKEQHNAVVTYKDITAKTPAEKAELFNSYFSSVFVPSKSTTDTDNNLDSFDPDTQISDITLTTEEVAACLYNLDISKASGPDGIPARILKECSHQIAPSLAFVTCSITRYALGAFPPNGNQLMLHPFTRKTLKSPSKITDRSPSCLSSAKFWNVVFPGDSTITSFTSSHHHNMVFLETVRVSLSLSKFFTLLVSVLTKTFSLI